MPYRLSNWSRLVTGLFFLICTGTATIFGADFLAEGEKQLSLDNPAKALTYLEAAAAQSDPTERLLLDLGLAYARVGQSDDAVRTFRQGADLHGEKQTTFLLNLGILYYRQKDWTNADSAFSEALVVDPTLGQALLNRANTRLNIKNWTGAEADYKSYQLAVPGNPQKAKIDQVIALLDQTVSDEQATKLAAETKQKQAEAAAAQAAADEKAQKEAKAVADAAEKQRQDAILAKVRESLSDASSDSQALSTGPSDVKSYSGDFSLDN